jgi:glycosyltransferase involved in cell wall biosynthesis
MTRIVRYYPRALAGDGGMTGAVRQWSRGLARAGADVVIAYEAGIDPPSDDLVRWVPVPHTGWWKRKAPVGLEEILREADVMVLHSGWTYHNVHAGRIARALGVPYVLEPRGAYDPHIVQRKRALKALWWRAWERDLVMGARAVHVFFPDERPHLEAIGYHGPLVVASNGVEAPEEPLWDGGSGGFVLWLGRFDPQHKGLDLLLHGLSSIAASDRPQVRLHGPEWRNRKQRVKRLVQRLGLEHWVHVGDPLYGGDKRRLLTSASGFIYPSRWDACPNSVLESVSLGVPTLATPYPLGRFLADRGGAFLAEAEPEAIGSGLRELFSADAPAVSRKGYEVVRGELGWDVVSRTWLQQVEALL